MDVPRFTVELLSDVLTDASAKQWRKRAADFRAARPRPGDFLGRATIEQQRDRWRRLNQLAAACEARAEMLDRYEQDWPEVTDALSEVAA